MPRVFKTRRNSTSSASDSRTGAASVSRSTPWTRSPRESAPCPSVSLARATDSGVAPDATILAASDSASARVAGSPASKLTSNRMWLEVSLRSEEHTSELQSLAYLVCRLLLEKKKTTHCAACQYALH